MYVKTRTKLWGVVWGAAVLCTSWSHAAFSAPPPDVTSDYGNIFVSADFNGWSTSFNRMILVADYQWVGIFSTTQAIVEFKFTADDSWDMNWGGSSQNSNTLPLQGVASAGGGNIVIGENPTGRLKFSFCETSGVYRVEATDDTDFIPLHYFVDASRPDNSGNGRSRATAKRTIQAAIDLAKDGDFVWVTNGVYEPIRASYRRITIQSINGAEHTIIDAGRTNRCADLAWTPPCTKVVGFTFQNGHAGSGRGGGVSGGILVNCVIRSNSIYGTYDPRRPHQVGEGGGMAYGRAYNCLIIDNYAQNKGGGAYGIEAYNCTVANNHAATAGGIISSWAENCILLENTAMAEPNHAASSIRYSCSIPVPPGEGNFYVDPLFVNPDGQNYRLSPLSPCINAGNNACVSEEYDLAGMERIQGPRVDMGAYEAGGENMVAVSVSLYGGGIISPMRQILPKGTTATFVAYPSDPQQNDVLFFTNGVYSGSGLFYVWPNVQEDSTLSAVFNEGRPTRYVDASRPDNSGHGLSWAAAKRTIQAAVDISTPGDTIHVAEGVYTPVHLRGTSNLLVVGVAGPDKTIIDGGGSNSCISAENSEIQGFTLRNGYAQHGGGIYRGTARNCIISNNSTRPFSYPSFGEGGGAYGANLFGCLVISNRADYGGGIYALYGNIISNCQFIGNSADVGGGAYMGRFWNCTIQGNQARRGAGTVRAYMNNCVIVDNHASESGGGIYEYGRATNCTIVLNTAAYAGGAWGGELKNCILWGNVATQGLYDNFVNLADYTGSDLNDCCTTPLPTNGTGNIEAYPYFVDLENGDFRLQSISFCVDAGNNDYVTTDVDLAGNPRIQNARVDMGAFEGGVVIPMTVTTEIPVPYIWLDKYNLAPNGNYEAAAHSTNTHDGRAVWKHYLTSTDPTNPASIFAVRLDMVGGQPVVTWSPDNPARNYILQGSTNIADNAWNAPLEESQFFRATVSMPPSR